MLQKLFTAWFGDRPAGHSPLHDGLGFTIRFAYPDDETGLRRLAALDSQAVLTGPVLVAEVGGELWAAVSVGGDRRAIADPFRPTAELVEVLHQRARRLIRRRRERTVSTPTVASSSPHAVRARAHPSVGADLRR